MANDRLDRLERQARNGYASPEQMLKLIGEVRRRRQESSDTYVWVAYHGDTTVAVYADTPSALTSAKLTLEAVPGTVPADTAWEWRFNELTRTWLLYVQFRHGWFPSGGARIEHHRIRTDS